MIAPAVVENILLEIGLSKRVAQKIAPRAKVLPRNRGGAVVIHLPASGSELQIDIYVKQYQDKRMFFRELTTIKLLGGAGECKNLSLAPRLVYSNEKESIIATEAIQGVAFSKILKDTLRLDKILFRGKITLSSILVIVKELMEKLSRIYVAPSSFPHGYDNRPMAIMDRVKGKLTRLLSDVGSKSLLCELRAYLEDIQSNICSSTHQKEDSVYLHGDLCFSNIMVQQNKPRLLDFEDSGYGTAGRDMAYLIYLLGNLERHPMYCNSRTRFFLESLKSDYRELFSVPKAIENLWHLEWVLNEIALLSLSNVNRVVKRYHFGRCKNRMWSLIKKT